MATVAMVKVVYGEVFRWQRVDFGLTWYKNDVSYCLTRCATHFFPGTHNLYQLLPFFLSFQGQRLQKKAIYTDGYQSALNVKIRGNFDLCKMDESHCMEPDVNTPEFSPKQITALYLKFKPEAFCYRC